MKPNELTRLLKSYNPWWNYPTRWFRKDPFIRSFDESILKKEPRLYYHLRKYIVTPNAYGIVTIRGPRRVGKTTIIKLLIKYLIEEVGINPRHIFYISLDYDGLSNVRIVDLIKSIAEIDPEDEKYIFIDEASMRRDWAQALKNIYDMGLIEGSCLKIVVTGSHSMDLADAASRLRGRQGRLASLYNVSGNLVFVPLRFPEVVEALTQEINGFLSERRLRIPKHRFKLLLELSKGNIPETIQYLYDNYFQRIESILEDYLLHGGYSKAIDEYNKNDEINASLYSDIASLLINDSKAAGLDPENIRRVLEILINPSRLSGPLDLSKLEIIGRDEDAKPKSRFGMRDYIDYLRTTWTFFFSYPEEGKSESCRPNYREQPKCYVLDPFLYHSIYCYLNNISDPFNNSKKLLNNSTFKGLLVESVVASHLLLSQQLFAHVPNVEYDRVLMYKKRSEVNKEIDFVLCLTRGTKQYRFIIESKYRKSMPHMSHENGKIVLTKEVLEVRDGCVHIPVSLFLLLF
ncbi:MAG: ATP-binding protein [Thaumarchaeota archaeon]|nr:MAG: ATP-binding protein [Nitrososphaerota archaeon]